MAKIYVSKLKEFEEKREIAEMLINVDAFTHWLYYAHHEFVKRAWKDNANMARHFQEKLDGFIKRDNQGFMGLETLVKFHQELDSTNRKILYAYIIENHSNKWR